MNLAEPGMKIGENSGKLLILRIIQFLLLSSTISAIRRSERGVKRTEEINNINFHEFFLSRFANFSERSPRRLQWNGATGQTEEAEMI